TVELQTSLESLNEERRGTVYLVVSNTSTSLLTVEAVAVDKPSFVTIPIPMDIATEAIPPGHQRAIPLSVTANDTVTPGKYLLVFTVTLASGPQDTPVVREVVASQKVDIGVFGESQILDALKIPSILLLPGLLAIGLASLL